MATKKIPVLVPDHVFVPKHEILKKEEALKVLKNFNSNTTDLPYIYVYYHTIPPSAT